MPTVLLILGWRLFFYANEGNEPMHIHCKKVIKSVSIGLIVKILILKRLMLLVCHHVTGERLKKLYLNTLNILNKNGMHLNGGANSEKVS